MSEFFTYTPESVDQWLNAAQPGQMLLYHIGSLTRDRVYRIGVSGQSPMILARQPLHSTAKHLWKLYVAGKVELVQRKVDERYLYYAVKRKRVKPLQRDWEW